MRARHNVAVPTHPVLLEPPPFLRPCPHRTSRCCAVTAERPSSDPPPTLLLSCARALSLARARRFLHPPREHPVQRHIPDELSGAQQRQTLVFENISRINHSCASNATFTWFSKSQAAEVRATQPIKAGDEITINYGASGSVLQRQHDLQQCFHFKCTCERCRSELEAERQARPNARHPGTLPPEDVAREKASRWAELERWLRDQQQPPQQQPPQQLLPQQQLPQQPPSQPQARAPRMGASRPSTPSRFLAPPQRMVAVQPNAARGSERREHALNNFFGSQAR